MKKKLVEWYDALVEKALIKMIKTNCEEMVAVLGQKRTVLLVIGVPGELFVFKGTGLYDAYCQYRKLRPHTQFTVAYRMDFQKYFVASELTGITDIDPEGELFISTLCLLIWTE